MVHRCCISSCGMSVRVVEAKGLSYHKFPNKETVRDQWIQAIIPHMDKPDAFKIMPRYTRVCSRHFRKKDYCVDVKKRARLISNAVPSVFPRKNTPLVIPTVLPVSPKMTNNKASNPNCNVPGTSSNSKIGNNKTVTSASANTTNKTNDTTLLQPTEIDEHQLVDLLGSQELFLESVTVHDDHLSFTVIDPVSQIDLECVSVANSDDQSTGSVAIKIEDSCGGTKRRKRRKWNRTAFARPAKGKRKLLSSKPEPSVDQDFSDSLSEVHCLSQGDIVGENEVKVENENNNESTSVEQLQSSGNESDSVSTVTLMLPDFPSQPYHINHASVEQELLQSIQAVSLTCGGEHEDVDTSELHDTSVDDMYQYNNLVPAFLHHHSSEESLFSNESQNVGGGFGDSNLSTVTQSDVVTEDDSLRFELVDLRLDEIPSSHPPTCLDIEELAQQLNSSLFTDGKIPLFSSDNLNLSSAPSSDLSLADSLLVTSEDNSDESVKPFKPPFAGKPLKPIVRRGASNKMKGSSMDIIISPKEKKLKGVSKRPKKDKIVGKFSVERFKNSDKDIEYYTGFSTFRNFEAFFRSLEAYIEKICITDVTYGVNNLPTTTDGSTSSGESSARKPNDQPKKRPCQGRAMSRVNELFMTIIRLRRKLPEKVLGHMFFISQPTVSRVVRAWTVLLSKIIDSYPVESSLISTSAYKEHSYTSKGLGIPDSFRDLFYSDLAKSIVITSLNPKKMKPKTSTAEGTRNKKSKRNSATTSKEETKFAQPSKEKLILGSDFLIASIENPEPIEHLEIFGN